MLLTKEVEVILQGINIKYYEDLGYNIPRTEVIYRNKDGSINKKKIVVKRGTAITVRVEDLQPNSAVYVDVLCDICKENISHITYSAYTRQHSRGIDCCKCCAPIKNKLNFIKKYGVEHNSQVPEFQEKRKVTHLTRYGVESIFQVPEIRTKIKNTMLERYGVENASQVKVFSNKAIEHSRQTMYQNGTAPTSSQQIEVYNMLLADYGEDKVKLNYPCGKCSLDVVLLLNDYKINIEYDGRYWHPNPQKDMARDVFVKEQGYKVLRIKSSEMLPDKIQLYDAIDKLINSEHTYYEIVLPDWITQQND